MQTPNIVALHVGHEHEQNLPTCPLWGGWVGERGERLVSAVTASGSERRRVSISKKPAGIEQ